MGGTHRWMPASTARARRACVCAQPVVQARAGEGFVSNTTQPFTTQPGVSWGVCHECRARAEARCVEHCEVQRRPPCAQVGRRGRHEVLCPCAPHSPAQAVAHVCEEREPHGARGGVSAAAHRGVCACDHRAEARWQRGPRGVRTILVPRRGEEKRGGVCEGDIGLVGRMEGEKKEEGRQGGRKYYLPT